MARVKGIETIVEFPGTSPPAMTENPELSGIDYRIMIIVRKSRRNLIAALGSLFSKCTASCMVAPFCTSHCLNIPTISGSGCNGVDMVEESWKVMGEDKTNGDEGRTPFYTPRCRKLSETCPFPRKQISRSQVLNSSQSTHQARLVSWMVFSLKVFTSDI